MREYRFLSCWLIASPREPIFEALWDSEAWPRWWPGLLEARQSDPGGPDGIGRRGHYEWRSGMGYRVRFEVVSTGVERPWLLEGVAQGDLEGRGRWRLFEQAGVTAVVYEWRVRTTRRWMNALAPIAEPILRRNHNRVMAAGAEGLARWIGAPLFAAE